MKIAIIGSNGMLGDCVYNYLLDNHDFTVLGYERETLKDLYNSNIQFDYLINCAGAIPQRYNLETKEGINSMIESNILLPLRLSELKNVKRFLQIATDCSFSGNQIANHPQDCYNENSLQDGTGFYSWSKSLGEVRQKNFHHLRCSIVGREKNSNYSLLNWFLSQNGEVPAYINTLWNGISCLEFAKICEKIITENIELPHVLHVVPPDWVSKFNLLTYFREIYKKDISIKGILLPQPIDRRLSTIYPELSKKLSFKCIYNMIDEQKKFYDKISKYEKSVDIKKLYDKY